jgi:hypothetical protein
MISPQTRNFILSLLSPIAKLILFVIGWEFPNQKIFSILNRKECYVLVYSHTTYADFYIFLLYYIANHENFSSIKTLVKPEPFEYAGKYLRAIGAIPATQRDIKNGNGVNKIVYELKQYDNFKFLISPKGTITNAEWRHGYYAIAKETKSKLTVVGLDYEIKQLVIHGSISYDKPKEEIERYLKEELGKIVPLFPEEEISLTIRHHNENKRTIINYERFTIIILLAIVLTCSFYRLIRN